MQRKSTKEQLKKTTVLILLLVNILPIYGVVVFGWDAFSIVLLYWAENIIIGFYNIFKIVFAKVERPILHLGKVFLIPFFLVHYGGFVAVHGIFIFLLFGKSDKKV